MASGGTGSASSERDAPQPGRSFFVSGTDISVSSSHFARQVWLLISNWAGNFITVPGAEEEDVEDWWTRTLKPLSTKQRRSTAALLCTRHGRSAIDGFRGQDFEAGTSFQFNTR
ncbi:hypothetical protein SETIT_9G528800v2 [Setaria italica]|uniref:Uncharacterized protein n=1 Tax=Setaria italica TaxID=4555 RepID=A0A368SVK1_SETIT|nr:hypothetical protein SETIT_9G528800v2 [Setaria italica]